MDWKEDDENEILSHMDGLPEDWDDSIRELNRVLALYSSPLETIIETSCEEASRASSHTSIETNAPYLTPKQTPSTSPGGSRSSKHTSSNSISNSSKSIHTYTNTAMNFSNPDEVVHSVNPASNNAASAMHSPSSVIECKTDVSNKDEGDMKEFLIENTASPSDDDAPSAAKCTSSVTPCHQSAVDFSIQHRLGSYPRYFAPNSCYGSHITPTRYKRRNRRLTSTRERKLSDSTPNKVKQVLKFLTPKSLQKKTPKTSFANPNYYQPANTATAFQFPTPPDYLLNTSTSGQSNAISDTIHTHQTLCNHPKCLALQCHDIPIIIIHDTETGQQMVHSPRRFRYNLKGQLGTLGSPLSAAVSAPCLYTGSSSLGSLDSSGDLFFQASEPNISRKKSDAAEEQFQTPCVAEGTEQTLHNHLQKRVSTEDELDKLIPCNSCAETTLNSAETPQCNTVSLAPKYSSTPATLESVSSINTVVSLSLEEKKESVIVNDQIDSDHGGQTVTCDIPPENGAALKQKKPRHFLRSFFSTVEPDESVFIKELNNNGSPPIEAPPQRENYAPWKNHLLLASLAATYLVLGFSLGMLGPMLHVIGRHFDETDTTAASLLSVREGGATVGFVVCYMLIHRWNFPLLMSVTLLASGLAHVGLPFLWHYSYVLIIMAAQGVTQGILMAGVAIMGFHHLAKVSQTQLIHTCYGVGLAAGPMLSLYCTRDRNCPHYALTAANITTEVTTTSDRYLTTNDQLMLSYSTVTAFMMIMFIVYLVHWITVDRWSLHSTLVTVQAQGSFDPQDLVSNPASKKSSTPLGLFIPVAMIHFLVSGLHISYGSLMSNYIWSIHQEWTEPITNVITISLYYIFYTIGRALGGLTLHHVRAKKVVPIVSMILCTVTVIEVFVSSITELVLRFTAVVMGLCLGLLIPGTIVWVGSYLNRKNSGFLIASSCLGNIIVPSVSGWVLDKHHLEMYDWYKLALSVAVMLLCMLVLLVWEFCSNDKGTEMLEQRRVLPRAAAQQRNPTLFPVLEVKGGDLDASRISVYPSVMRKKKLVLCQYLHSVQYYMTGFTALFVGHFERTLASHS